MNLFFNIFVRARFRVERVVKRFLIASYFPVSFLLSCFNSMIILTILFFHVRHNTGVHSKERARENLKGEIGSIYIKNRATP
jgi:hypothetical protein